MEFDLQEKESCTFSKAFHCMIFLRILKKHLGHFHETRFECQMDSPSRFQYVAAQSYEEQLIKIERH